MTTFNYSPDTGRCFLNGMVWEWHQAIGELPVEHRRRMRLPHFEIREVLSVWGKWLPEQKAIVLSQKLVAEHPWLSVREVLRHEIAHQVVDEAMRGDDAPHGDLFKKACRMIRADPRAATESPSIREWINEDHAGSHDRMSSRIDKLLALAGSNSRHEAETAMTLAHELMAKHNIKVAEFGAPAACFSMCIGAPVTRFTTCEYAVMRLLREYYFVSTVVINVFAPDKDRPGRALEISGRIENLRMANYVHGFLHRVIDEQWRTFKRDNDCTHHHKMDFALGLIDGVRGRLEGASEAVVSTERGAKALVLKGQQDLRTYIEQRYPRLQSCGHRGRLINERVHRAGKKVGQQTVISKPVENGTGSRRGLLGA